MSFNIDSIVPWGRTLDEYRKMFLLNDIDMNKNIAGFGDGPASFNFEATKKGYSVTSFDPIYQFSKNDLKRRINEVRIIVMQQMKENLDNYVWKSIKSLDELEKTRMFAMNMFLNDYEEGIKEKRYIYHELPEKLPYSDNSFDIGLSSHFLLMYTSLGYDFHIKAITEMLRVCKEVRIFPVVDLDAKKTKLIFDVIDYFQNIYCVKIKKTSYKFQKNADSLLIIKDKLDL